MADPMSRRDFVSLVSSVTGTLVFGTWLPGCMAPVGVGDPGGGDEGTPEWEAEARALEDPMVYDSTTQWMGEDKAAAHVPKVTLADGTLLVLVDHPMTPEHYITTIYVRDQDDVIISFVEYTQPAAGTDAIGVETAPLTLDASVTRVTVYAHCNQHNVWRAAPQDVA